MLITNAANAQRSGVIPSANSGSSDRLVVLFSQRRLTKFSQQLIQPLKRDSLRRCDLDSDRATIRGVVDDEKSVRRRHGPRALLAGWMREG
jgi:hypothetical protein